MSKSRPEILAELLGALETLEKYKGTPELEAESDRVANLISPHFNRAPAGLKPRIERLKVLMTLDKRTKEERAEAGKILEEIVALAFAGVAGWKEIENFETTMSQIDLYVTGDSILWPKFIEACGLKFPSPVLVECKAHEDSFSITDFRRFCDLLEHQFSSTNLGIVFACAGAAGFPDRDDRKECVRFCWLAQLLFHASKKKHVIVFDLIDIEQLAKPGALTLLIRAKLDEIEKMKGTWTPILDKPKTVSGPAHIIKALKEYEDEIGTQAAVSVTTE